MKDKICGFYLDKEQEEIVTNEDKHLLVVAGAGSGKTMTILGKINYLIKYKKINKDNILCISFTNAASQSLKDKIKQEFNIDMPVYTFHKLALEIIKKENQNYTIASTELLDQITHNFFYVDVFNNLKLQKIILKYFKYTLKNNNSYNKLLQEKNKEIQELENLVKTFIKLFKCNGYEIDEFPNFFKIIKKNILRRNKENYLLLIIFNIYLIYIKYLEDNKEIDFDDMIIKAKNIIKNTNKSYNYQYIIIDEYQDTSFVRFQLINELLIKTNASLMVVGDDFQSIYRFTGCDLDLFLNFQKYFTDAKIMKIQNTYRNSQELIKIAGDFVMRNKKQIKKNLKSTKHLDYPIEIKYYKEIKKDFKSLIDELISLNKKDILILGRNNRDINYVLDEKYFKYQNNSIIYQNKDCKLNFLTVHKSKGLEEKDVIIINLNNSILGFPNQLKDEKILRLVSKNKEKMPFCEERRLFYVALTRTKNKVYLFTSKENESIFVKELKLYYRNLIKINKLPDCH